MTRIRVALAITTIIGAIYAAAGLFDSLGQFALGTIIAATAVMGYGLVDYVEHRRREELSRYRAEVWHRRDLEARQAWQTAERNAYEYPRDGLNR